MTRHRTMIALGLVVADSFDVTVTEGTYTYVCDPHARSMNGNFDVSG